MIINIIFALILIIAICCEYYAFKTGVPTVASFPSARRKIIEILQNDAAARPDARPYIIIDLGSGGGQLSWHIARNLPYAQVVGVELSFIPWFRSVVRQRLFGPANLNYKRSNFWPYDCSKADAVVLFLKGNVMDRVSEKLHEELKSGSLIVSNDYTLRGDWQPIATQPAGFFDSKIYVYRQP